MILTLWLMPNKRWLSCKCDNSSFGTFVVQTITIRKFSDTPLTIENLMKFGSLSPEMAGFLEAGVRGKLNILVSGGTGSGKTTLLNVLSAFIPHDERIVTIEDAAELKLMQDRCSFFGKQTCQFRRDRSNNNS